MYLQISITCFLIEPQFHFGRSGLLSALGGSYLCQAVDTLVLSLLGWEVFLVFSSEAAFLQTFTEKPQCIRCIGLMHSQWDLDSDALLKMGQRCLSSSACTCFILLASARSSLYEGRRKSRLPVSSAQVLLSFSS